jgi:putative DNA primase/helicase
MSDVDVTETISEAPEHQEPFVATIQRLADMPVVEYEHIRIAEAKRLNMRTTVLDKEVKAARSTGADENDLGLFEPDPWPEEVAGDDLLDQIVKAICRYVVMPPHTAEAAALWVLHCHSYEAFQHTPRLAVASPQKGCGKTTLLDTLGALVPRAVKTETLTVAVLFRVIDKYGPTLLIDEVDTFLQDNDELRGVLNAGHRRGALAHRCEGDNNEIRSFKTFAPVATGGIGRLPGTLEDRSICITLQRRKPSEPIVNFRSDRVDHLHNLASQAARWAEDHMADLRHADPDIPARLYNRVADNWRPLLAIADNAGGDWPEKAREAAIRLSGNIDDDDSAGVKLLADIRSIFETKPAISITSADLVVDLVNMEDRPWPEWRRGKPITTVQVSRLLKPFGINSTTIRADGHSKPLKGYKWAAFEEVFARYLPPPASSSVTPLQPKETAGHSDFRNVTPEGDVTDQNPPKATETTACNGVTVQKGGNGLCVHCGQSATDDPDAVQAAGDGLLHHDCYDDYFGFQRA